MNNRRTKHLVSILVTQLSVAGLMFLLGISIVFYAAGFRFNWLNFKIIKTGIIFVADGLKTSDVYINGKLVSKKMPYSKTVIPGTYTVTVKKEGFHDWQRTMRVEPELVSDCRTIVLFKDSSDIKPLSDPAKMRLLDAPIDSLTTTGGKELFYNDFEIWTKDRLVTRFSEPISGAIWYPGNTHVIYQQGDELRVIEVSGINDLLLVKLHENKPTRFDVSKDGNELYFVDDDQYYSATIK